MAERRTTKLDDLCNNHISKITMTEDKVKYTEMHNEFVEATDQLENTFEPEKFRLFSSLYPIGMRM